MLAITEIYTSVQGESSWVGKPCTFIRLSGCPLRCKWCDTVYGFKKGDEYSIEDLVAEVKKSHVKLVEITGGEPLAQEETPKLIEALIKEGYEVLIETSGSEPIRVLPEQTNIIMDLKCPDSKMSDKNLYENIDYLKPSDEVKFVVASKEDFEWAYQMIREFDLENRCKLLISPAWGLVKPDNLVEWILEYQLDCRLNLQVHKYIWDPRKKGV